MINGWRPGAAADPYCRLQGDMDNDQVRKLNLERWPLPEDHLVELGRVAALWATLESFLNICIGKLAGFDELNHLMPFILVNHSSFPQRLDMLGALCEQLAGQFPNLLGHGEVIGKLRAAQSLRNRFMHHGMSFDPETGDVRMAIGTARGAIKTSVQRVDLADIRRAAMEIHLAQLELYKLVLRRELRPVWERQDA